MPNKSYRRSQQIPATRHGGKTNIHRLLIRQSFLTTFCIALYLMTATHATVPNQNVYSSDDFTDICRTRASFRRKKGCRCIHSSVPHKQKAHYKTGKANGESQTMRDPPQPVQQISTKQFPPMTSTDDDFPDRTVYEVPRSNSTLNHEFLSQERSYVNPCIAQRREHRSEKDTTSAFPYL